MKSSYSAAVLLAAQLSTAQQVGTLKTPNLHLPMQIQSCTAPGTCANEAAGVTLDGNWRWLHKAPATATNCYTGDEWDATLCPDPTTCTTNCAMDGVPQVRVRAS